MKEIKIYEPSFEPKEHLYSDESGNRLECVTDILQGELGGFEGFPESAALRGTDVHKTIQAHNEGNLIPSEISLEVWDYLECFLRAQKHYGIKVLQSEIRRYSPKYMYAGTCDAVVEISGIKGIIDYKTGGPDKRNKWQLAAYTELLKAEIPDLKGRWNLYLKPGQYEDGFNLVEHNSKRDFNEFLALFAAFQIKKNNGYIKEKRNI